MAGKTAFVAVGAANEVAKIDLDDHARVRPRGRGTRAARAGPGSGRLALCSRQRCAPRKSRSFPLNRSASFGPSPIEGDNLRQVAISADGKRGYIANMKNRGFATTSDNIDLGWVLGQRLTRVDLDTAEPSFATLSLDPRGKAAADAHGVAVSKDDKFLAVSLGGTHEVMIFRTDGRRLPWRVNGSRDLIPVELLGGDGRYRRVTLGGRPTELAFAPDDKTLYVANYLADAVQVVDAESARLIRTIPLGGPSTLSLARRGEILFHAAERSFNQWYSCNTCHSDGHTKRPELRHPQRRPPRPEHRAPTQPQEGAYPAAGHAHRPLDLARLANRPRGRHARVVHQEHARSEAVVRGQSRP